MCGVSGIVSPPTNDLQDAISSMVSVMHHRGPDGQGTFIDRISEMVALALGHNRLAVIDVTENAAQPMKSRDGRFVLIYNGEVYNYKEVAQDLDRRDLPDGFGDTAVVLAALIKWGPQALSRFNGMWALLFYDIQEKTLLVSRDRFGVKPLYFYRDEKSLYFASEIKAILAASEARMAVNPDVAVPYLTRGLLNLGDETFFANIRQFAPASYQLIDLRSQQGFRYSPVRFWHHPFEQGQKPSAGRVSPDDVRDLFIDAVKLRLRSDVPIGMLLSGGIDSSAILGGIAALQAMSGLTIFSVTSDDPAANEEPFIDQMARYVDLTPLKVNVSQEPLALLDRLSDATWFNDEPVLGGIAGIAYLRLIEAARARGIKVLLSGQGADEQLGGYHKFLYFWLLTLLKANRYVEALKILFQSAWQSSTLYEFRLGEAMRYIGRRRLASATFIAPAYQERDDIDLGLQDSYERREWIDLTSTSVPALLHCEDRMSMSQSIEVRVPFLDFRLVELLARVHPSEKFDGGWTKSIFRKAISGLVPREIQYRRDKKGFSVPEDHWMKGAFRSRTMKMFHSEMMAEDLGLIDRKLLLCLYERFVAGRGYLNGRHFCRVYAFESFLRRFATNISGCESQSS